MKCTLKSFRRYLVTTAMRSAARLSLPCPAGKALIIAPHPDDETFGCAGLIAMKRAGRMPVDILFLTSGEASHNGCCRSSPAAIADARRGQALSAATLLGVTREHLHWLGMKDGQIESVERRTWNMERELGKTSQGSDRTTADTAVQRIAELITTLKPDEIYCPHPLDCWPDHEAAVELVAEAIKVSSPDTNVSADHTAPRPHFFFYLIWGWYQMPFGRLRHLRWWSDGVADDRKSRRLRSVRMDITSVLDKKLAAIQEYLGKHPENCPHPYVGELPKGFLDPFKKPYEIFFECTE